jgi:hypothetical protein
MARATLLLDVDTTPARSALGDLRGSARSAQASLTAEARKGERERERVMRDESRAAQRAASEAARARARLERESTRAAQQAERERTRNAEKSAAERLRIERDETRKKDRESREAARNADRAEKERTRNAERESAKRVRAEEREARQRSAMASRNARAAGQRVIGAGVQAVGAAAVAMHGQFQDARERRAASEHTLDAAFYQAGVSGAEAQRMRAQIQREVASGSLRGLSTQQVSESIMGAQTEFSVLSQGVTPQMTSAQAEAQRQTNLNRQVELMSLARNTYQDPGEVMRVAGMLGQQGIHGTDQRSMLLSLTGMAQAGSIELSTLSSTALGPLMQNLARVTNANMTPEQRAAAVQRTTAETMAVGEIGRAAGLSPRDSINALAKMRGSVVNERTQEKLFSRLTGEHREELASQLFETDAQGRHRLRNQDPIGLMSSLVTGFGGDANAVSNLLGAGGSAAPMVLDAQQRRLIMGMASQTEGGQTIAQRVSGMQAIGERFGEDDVARGASMVAGETHTTLQANEEQRDNVLTDNTSGVKALSDSIRDWRVRHPWLSGLAQEGGSTLGVSNDAALGVLIGSGVNERRLRSGTNNAGQRLGFGEGVLRTLGVAIPALGAVLGTNDLGSTAQRQPGAALNAPPAGQAAPTVAQVSLTPNDHAAIGSATAAALRAQPITAEVPLSADIHARAAGTRR